MSHPKFVVVRVPLRVLRVLREEFHKLHVLQHFTPISRNLVLAEIEPRVINRDVIDSVHTVVDATAVSLSIPLSWVQQGALNAWVSSSLICCADKLPIRSICWANRPKLLLQASTVLCCNLSAISL